jgi:hypothetical protein
MWKRYAAFLFVIAVSTTLMAHQGHSHQLLGTVERVRDCHFVLKNQNGESKAIFLTPSTKFERGSQQLSLKDLAVGSRVAISLEEDDETAVTVKVGGAK